MPSGHCTLLTAVRFFRRQTDLAGIHCLVRLEVPYGSLVLPMSERAKPNGASSDGALIGARPG